MDIKMMCLISQKDNTHSMNYTIYVSVPINHRNCMIGVGYSPVN